MQKTRTLGKSGIEVSALGMGCWAIGGPWTWTQPGEEPWPAGWGAIDDNESVRAIHAALAAGVNFFDTAANYGAGHSEKILGKALKGRRAQAVIATKFGHIIDEERKTVYGDDERIIPNLRHDVENSLHRLNTDWIDLYQLHAGGFDPEPALELRGMLEALVQEGLIRSYGWSTDLVDRARVFAPGPGCAAIQFGLNALFDNPEMRQLCAENHLAGVNKDPLHRGMLTGKFTSGSKFPNDDIRSLRDYGSDEMRRRLEAVEALRPLLTSGGRTMAQGALAYIWALDENMIPIPGFKSVQQVEQNTVALDFGPLSQEELDQVRAIVAGFDL
ncbi:MAG: aldo/keto reductase [Anaerolineales bacterium]|jgi:aryl-alcohol dehydrogenase-like predicted oxidoreductase